MRAFIARPRRCAFPRPGHRTVHAEIATPQLAASRAAGSTAELCRAGDQPRELETRNPLAHFIEQGNCKAAVDRADPRDEAESGSDAAAHRDGLARLLPGLIDEFMGCLAGNLSRCDLFVTTGREEDLARLKKSLALYDCGAVEVAVVPNRGRDTGPFLTHYQWLKEKYDLLGHLHRKKTANHEAAVGETWRHFLWWNLLGDKFPMLDVIACDSAR